MKKFKLLFNIALLAAVLTACNKNEPVGGTIINGVWWAKCNVGEFRTFVANPEDAGMLYQWNRSTAWNNTDAKVEYWDYSFSTSKTWSEATDPCPAGWRVPKYKELQSLLNETYVTKTWTIENEINGYCFTDIVTGNTIFMPAAGWRDESYGTLYNPGTYGVYWSSTESSSKCAHFFSFDSDNISLYGTKAAAFSVRCVAK